MMWLRNKDVIIGRVALLIDSGVDRWLMIAHVINKALPFEYYNSCYSFFFISCLFFRRDKRIQIDSNQFQKGVASQVQRECA